MKIKVVHRGKERVPGLLMLVLIFFEETGSQIPTVDHCFNFQATLGVKSSPDKSSVENSLHELSFKVPSQPVIAQPSFSTSFQTTSGASPKREGAGGMGGGRVNPARYRRGPSRAASEYIPGDFFASMLIDLLPKQSFRTVFRGEVLFN